MPDTKILIGGAAVESLILVNVDNETVLGDGSREDPLRTSGGGGPLTIERLLVIDEAAVLDPDTTISFVTYGGPESTVNVGLSLAAPTDPVDGQQKQVLMEAFPDVTWRVIYSGTDIEIDESAHGGVILAWSIALDAWVVVERTSAVVS